jgi:hypothetical protein
MNDELEGIWKEAVGASSRFCPGICLKELRKTTKYLRHDSVPAEIRNEYLLNISLQHFL